MSGASNSAPSSLLGTLDAIAREAAVLILQVYATKFSVDFKAPRDPVTEADRLANELICDRLSKLFPNVPICCRRWRKCFARTVTKARAWR